MEPFWSVLTHKTFCIALKTLCITAKTLCILARSCSKVICSLGRSVGRSIAHSAAQSLDRSVDRAPLRDLWEPGRYESRFAPLPTPPELTICVIDEVRIAIRTAGQPIRAPEMCHWWGGTRCESRFAQLASQPEHRRCVIDISQKPLLKDVSNKNTTFTGFDEFVAGGRGE